MNSIAVLLGTMAAQLVDPFKWLFLGASFVVGLMRPRWWWAAPIISLAMVIFLAVQLHSWWASLGMTAQQITDRLVLSWFAFALLSWIAYALPLIFRALKPLMPPPTES